MRTLESPLPFYFVYVINEYFMKLVLSLDICNKKYNISKLGKKFYLPDKCSGHMLIVTYHSCS